MVIIQTVILAVSALLLGYLMLLSMLALIERRRPVRRSSALRRFAFVVPAHNEELSIRRTVDSLMAVEYERDNFDVYVVADNCTDSTADLAQRSGAVILERFDETSRGKGHALRWAFNRLLSAVPAYDAVIVVDADSVVDPGFLRVLNNYFAEGAAVIQCNDMVRKNAGSWSSEMTRIGFILFNYVRPLGRRLLGFSAGLRGNGMAFSADVLRKHPWEAYSRAEDLEFGIILLLRGISVRFAPEALVTATMPERSENAETQRLRWEGGRLPVIKRYAGRLIARTFARASFSSLDALIDLVTPPLVTMLAVLVGCGGLHLLAWAAGWESDIRFALLWFAVAGLGIAHMILGLIAYRADRQTYVALLFIPRYAFWKLLLLGKQLFRPRTREWIRTTRESGNAPVTDRQP